MTGKILIVGASVRAAAQSARRAGLQPYAVDMFADQDLRALCPVQKVNAYPGGLVAAAQQHPPSPWMYTGAVENHPQTIATISLTRPLWGNGPQSVRAVRDPWRIAQSFSARRLPFPELRQIDEPLPPGEWICKPFRSGGGLSIRRVSHKPTDPHRRPSLATTHYLQRSLPGESIAAVYVGTDQRALSLGVTKQLVGDAYAGANEFAYVGSIGPLMLSLRQQQQVDEIGRCLVEEFGLTGLFGVDAILCGDEVWTVEVNPRYTASVEVLERALSVNSISLHASACAGKQLPDPAAVSAPQFHGKRIVYAHRSLAIGNALVDWAQQENATTIWPNVADIPAAGSSIRAGHPVCTVLASGESMAEVATILRDRTCQVLALVERAII